MTCSKFITLALIALALVFGTRWCIVFSYSGTYAPTDKRLQGQMQFASPTSSSAEEDAPASTLVPQFQAFQASRGR